MKTRRQKGKEGEQIAATFLQQTGCRILARNYRYRHGEIDLVALYADMVIFVEVKSYMSGKFASPEWKINDRKKQSLLRTAWAFLLEHPELESYQPRFDVIVVRLDNNPAVVEHYPGALYFDDLFQE